MVHEVAHVEWVEADPREATCSKELGTGSVLIRVVVTKTLPGGWSVTSAKLPNLRAWAVVLLSPQVVTEAEVDRGCAGAGVWTAVGRQESEAQVDPVVSVEVGEVTAVDSEAAVEWTGEASVEPGVEDRPWTEWVVEGEEEWDHLVARWI